MLMNILACIIWFCLIVLVLNTCINLIMLTVGITVCFYEWIKKKIAKLNDGDIWNTKVLMLIILADTLGFIAGMMV